LKKTFLFLKKVDCAEKVLLPIRHKRALEEKYLPQVLTIHLITEEGARGNNLMTALKHL
jgi:hypothetical protein